MGNILPALEKDVFFAEIRRLLPVVMPKTRLSEIGPSEAPPSKTEPLEIRNPMVQEEASLDQSILEGLWIHYRELIRWNPRLSLVGPGTADELVNRHFGEALAALPYLPEAARVLDVGSGGGFPGLVLAAACPGLEVFLVEPKQRKVSFLQTVIRKIKAAGIALSCHVLDARVDDPLPVSPALPQNIDLVTCRALVLGPPRVRALVRRYPGVRFLLWASLREKEDVDSALAAPAATSLLGTEGTLGLSFGFETPYRVGKRIPLADSRYRHIVELMPET
ncbi:MAG: RsmG family class I SAM-dependent methyltransferase [Acidobacteriota bacterium]